MEDEKTVTLEKDTDENIKPKAKSSFLKNLEIVGIVLLALAVVFLANKAISYMGNYSFLIVLAIIMVAGSVNDKKLLRRIVALIIIVSAVFGTAFLASKFNYDPDPDADILAGAVGVIAWFSFLRFVLGVPNAVILVFILLLLVGAASMAMLAFVPSPMSGILSMAFMVVGWGTIFYLCVWKSANGGDSDDGFDGNDGIFDDGGIVGDGIFGADGIGGDGGGDGGGGGGDGGGGDGGGG